MSGLNTHTVQPFNDERTFLKGTSDVACKGRRDEQPEPATGQQIGRLRGLPSSLVIHDAPVNDHEADLHAVCRGHPSLVPTMGSANPNGVGDGTFDAQCGGACLEC